VRGIAVLSVRRDEWRCKMWSTKRTNVYLAEGQADALDRVAQAEGVSGIADPFDLVGQLTNIRAQGQIAYAILTAN